MSPYVCRSKVRSTLNGITAKDLGKFPNYPDKSPENKKNAENKTKSPETTCREWISGAIANQSADCTQGYDRKTPTVDTNFSHLDKWNPESIEVVLTTLTM